MDRNDKKRILGGKNMQLTGKLYLYKGQYGYSTTIKNQEDKMYIQVGFRKGYEPQSDRPIIDVKDAFLSMYTNKEGTKVPKIVVMSYEELESENNFGDVPVDTTWNEDDLPF